MSESQDHGSDGENSEETYKEPRVFRFLDLPAELRNGIYEYALRDLDTRSLHRSNIGPKPPMILQVNHQIRQEARSIYLAHMPNITIDFDKLNTYMNMFYLGWQNPEDTTAQKTCGHITILLGRRTSREYEADIAPFLWWAYRRSDSGMHVTSAANRT